MAKKLTARFFRVTVSVDSNPQKIGQIDWKRLLATEAGLSQEDRTLELGDFEIVFEKRDTGALHMAAHRLKDADEYLSQMGTDGKFTEVMAVDEKGNHFADTSCVSFKRDGNVFGIVQANQSSPRSNRIAEWLTERNPLNLTNAVYHAVPLRLGSIAEGKFKDADGATNIEFTLPIDQLEELGLSISKDSKSLANDLPGASITVRISAGRGRPLQALGKGLLDVAESVRLGVTTDDRAVARIYREVESKAKGKKKTKTRLMRETLDLVQFEIAHKFRLSVDHGEVRIDSTLNAIDTGFSAQAADLARALDES